MKQTPKESSRAKAAAEFNLPESKVRNAARLEREAPELAKKVRNSEATLRQAREELKKGKDNKTAETTSAKAGASKPASASKTSSETAPSVITLRLPKSADQWAAAVVDQIGKAQARRLAQGIIQLLDEDTVTAPASKPSPTPPGPTSRGAPRKKASKTAPFAPTSRSPGKGKKTKRTSPEPTPRCSRGSSQDLFVMP